MSDTINDQDLSISFSQSDRNNYTELLVTADEQLKTAQSSMASGDSSLEATQYVHNLHSTVRKLAMDIGDFWYSNHFKSYQRLTDVLACFADDEQVMSITVSDPNLVIDEEGFVINEDGSQHAGYRLPVYATNEDGTNTKAGYKPISSKHHHQTTVIGADVSHSIDGIVQDLFNRAKLRGIPVSQLDCTRLDGSVITLTITINYDEAVGYYTGLTVDAAGTSIDGLSHTVYSLSELTYMYGVDMDIDRLEDKPYMRLVCITIKDMAKVDRSIRHMELTTQAKYCLVERQ